MRFGKDSITGRPDRKKVFGLPLLLVGSMVVASCSEDYEEPSVDSTDAQTIITDAACLGNTCIVTTEYSRYHDNTVVYECFGPDNSSLRVSVLPYYEEGGDVDLYHGDPICADGIITKEEIT